MTTELSIYSGSQFIGKQVMVDREFIPELKKINQLALKFGLHVFVTSSIRRQGLSVGGSIVPPASRSNHLIGHAIDMNLKLGRKLYNSSRLKNSKLRSQPKAIRKFIKAIRNDSRLRWGGDFSPQDPVHIDDNINNKAPAIWDEKLQIIQQALINLGRPQAEPGEPRLLFLERPQMTGADVRSVQERLIELSGQFSMNPDGVFGPVTDRAVTTFQEQNNLEPDGIVGPGTRKALKL
jgi:hypothetical protein